MTTPVVYPLLAQSAMTTPLAQSAMTTPVVCPLLLHKEQ